ncbi:MAG: hypothetical protein WKF30_18995 [Pyrinomonadaceae bacterium]
MEKRARQWLLIKDADEYAVPNWKLELVLPARKELTKQSQRRAKKS